MKPETLSRLFDYAVRIRRRLHEYPETGFDLPLTTALVAAELDAMGIACTNRYGTCSIVAELGQGDELLAVRADMDALPVDEVVDVPFRSKHPGKMHACGHDMHTAVLLAVAGYLKAHESELHRRVRLIFQPSEEGQISGAEMMVKNGVMDGVDRIICTHCENMLDAGLIGVCPGDYQAACVPATITFTGRASHATLPENGIDAIAMAHDAYARMKAMVAQEAGERPYIWSVGRFSGGTVHNVIADRCAMDISFRFYDMVLEARVQERVRTICDEVAERCGGGVIYDWHISTGPVHNDPAMTAAFAQCCTAAGLDVRPIPRRMSSEDFGWYLAKRPGMIFRFGTRNEAQGCTTTAHCSDFKPDETGMQSAIRAFCAYIFSRN